MNFHDNTLWQKAYVALMDIYDTLDQVDDDVRESEEETVESLLVSAQNVAAKIADGLSRRDKRLARELLFDAIGLVAIVRTHLAIAWGRGLLDDEMFRSIDGKYQELSADLQR
ncbi:MAG: four helix bundle protein [Patescibacteria group bacterium]|nr:four helix bundle protein [Patescibacteria group bacterium]